MSSAWQLAIGTNTPTNVSAAAGKIVVSDPQYLGFAGGSNGAALTTDGASHLTWQIPSGSGGSTVLVDNVSIVGDGKVVALSANTIDGGTY